MRLATLAFLIGIILLHEMTFLPVAKGVVWAFLLLPLFYYRPLRIPLMLLFGFCWALFRAQLILQHQLPAQLEQKDVVVVGEVVGLASDKGRYLQFPFQVERLSHESQTLPSPGLVRLNWYHRSQPVHAGDRFRFTVRLKRPHGAMNPGGFDFEAWLFQRHIRATGYVRNRETIDYLGQGNGLAIQLHRLRGQLADELLQLSDSGPSQALLQALVLGERGRISDRQWQVLRNTGTSHLLAISGLHIGLVAGFCFALVRFLWGLSVRLTLWQPAQRPAALMASLAAIAYAALAGFTIPTQRALIMTLIVMWGWLSRRSYGPATILSAAALGVLLWDPLAPLAAGFWLSFAAVAVIFLILNQSPRQPPLLRWVRLQWGIFIGLFPLLLFWFQGLSLSAPLVNLLAIPWLAFLVMPCLLAALLFLPWSPFLAHGCLLLAQWGLEGLWWLLERAASLEWLSLNLPAPQPWVMLLALLGIAWWLLPRGIPGRWLGIVWLLPLFLVRVEDLAQGELRFTLLDVGQGLAAVVETRDHVLVYDSGPSYGRGYSAGEAVVVPYLRQQGRERVDRLLISHGDNDHIGGSRALRKSMPVGDILTSVPPLLPHSRRCDAGESWQWDGVVFKVLHPPAPYHLGRASENNRSCVLKVESTYGSILLSGDIEVPAEEHMLHQPGLDLRADYLVAPHHGSRSSSSAAFILAVDPSYVLFPVGYRNRYGFPHGEVVMRYGRAKQYNSAQHGALTVTLAEGAPPEPSSYRQEARRYWHSAE